MEWKRKERKDAKWIKQFGHDDDDDDDDDDNDNAGILFIKAET